VRLVELAPPRRIVEAVSFVTTDPAFLGDMTLTETFEEVSGGTEVTLAFKNLPPGLRPARASVWSSWPAVLNDMIEDTLGADPRDSGASAVPAFRLCQWGGLGDHAAAPSGFARSIRSRSRGLFIACHRSLRRCTFSQKSGLLPNTRARMSAVAAVTFRRLLHNSLTCLR
jgi:hypothetical protein